MTRNGWPVDERRDTGARPVMIGNADDVAEIVAEYDAVGVDELIIPDWTMGSYERRVETCDHFITQVAPRFR